MTINFPQAIVGILILWAHTLKHYYSIKNSLKTICCPASVCTLLPLSLWAYRFPEFERPLWHLLVHHFLKIQLKNSPSRGHFWINSILAYFDDVFTVFCIKMRCSIYTTWLSLSYLVVFPLKHFSAFIIFVEA